ncbi:Alpha-protein kinase vwkA [Geodia barretti]|uniref:Alpha-protein kinase vwkA n=1 Tax=Geodia barretti TaxID=519541 RepID=A0AA35RDV5_GEOBA|nr:Alpha-protein kinase vwkA [Geodia barretti]
MLWRVAVRYSSDRHILQLPNGRDTSVGELKELFQKEDPSLPHDLRIVFDGPRGRIVLSDDKKKLSEYREIQDGTVFRLDLTVVYVQAVNGQKYKIPIGTDKFYNYPVSALLKDVERVTRFSLTNHKLFLRHKPLLPTSLEGKALTLTDYTIRKEDTLLIQKESSDLNITNSQVDLCFMVDCTGSMASHIEAVKNSVKNLREDLVKQHRGCDLQFAFVRYTDYDVTCNRTTHLDFTKLDFTALCIS